MKQRCSTLQRSLYGAARGWAGLALAIALVLLCPHPLRAYAAMPIPDDALDRMPIENAEEMPQPQGVMEFPGAATGTFGPSEITMDGIITVSVCVLILCGGLAFCLLFRKDGKSF